MRKRENKREMGKGRQEGENGKVKEEKKIGRQR